MWTDRQTHTHRDATETIPCFAASLVYKKNTSKFLIVSKLTS